MAEAAHRQVRNCSPTTGWRVRRCRQWLLPLVDQLPQHRQIDIDVFERGTDIGMAQQVSYPVQVALGLRINSVPSVCLKRWGLTFSRLEIFLKQFSTCQIVMSLRVC